MPQTPSVSKKEIFGWAMFDFANSSYTTVVITAIYSAFFINQVIPADSSARNSYWSVAILSSTLLALLLSPLVGAICDYSGQKKRYLLGTTILCALSTMALYFVAPGQVWLGIALITLSNAAFMLSESFCGSFLTDLATSENMGFISGLGWGLGYFGGLASLLIVKGLVTAPETETTLFVHQTQIAMIATGAFFMMAAIPTFVWVRSRSLPVPGFEQASLRQLVQAGFKNLSSTWQTVQRYPIFFQFLVAFMVYMAGVDVVIKFVGIYATGDLKLETGDLAILFLILQISAAIGALSFGFLEARLGPKLTVFCTILWWIAGVLCVFWLEALAAFLGASTKHVFFGIAIITGSGIGSIQSSSRTVVGLLAPAKHSAEMFGFWGMFSRLATMLGMTFGFLADALDSRRWALLLVVGFFVIGGILLWRTPIEKGLNSSHSVR